MSTDRRKCHLPKRKLVSLAIMLNFKSRKFAVGNSDRSLYKWNVPNFGVCSVDFRVDRFKYKSY